MSEWFKRFFGRPPRRRRNLPFLPPLRDGDEITVEFLDPEPRILKTKYGQRLAIDVVHEGEEMTMVFAHVNLAEQLALLAEEHGSLEGLKVRIKRVGRQGRVVRFEVELLEKKGGEGE